MTRVGSAGTWISLLPHLLPRASGLGPWLTETGIGSANCNLVSLHVSFVIHCSSSKGGWEKKPNMIAELLIKKKNQIVSQRSLRVGYDAGVQTECLSARVRPAFSFWGDLRHFLPRAPSLSGSSTQFNGIFAQRSKWSELTQQQHSRPDRDPLPWHCRAQLMNKFWLCWWGIRNATTGIWINAQFNSQGAKFCP